MANGRLDILRNGDYTCERVSCNENHSDLDIVHRKHEILYSLLEGDLLDLLANICDVYLNI